MTDTPDTQFAETPVGRIAYQVVGDGPVDILVAHPLYFPIDMMWDEPRMGRFLDGLSTFSRHIWFDPRGRGASSPLPPDEGRFQETMLEDVIGLLDVLEIEKVALVALVGGIMPFFAATHPERTSALVTFNGFARLLRSDDFPEGVAPEALEEVFAAIRRNWGTVDGARIFSPRRATDEESFRRWLARGQRLTCPAEEAVWRLRSMLQFDQSKVLGTITVPTLVISRAPGPGLPPNASRDLAGGIDGAKLVELPGDDPLFFLGDTGVLLDTIEEFLTGDLSGHRSDRILATVMFTDLVGSTEQAARLGDRRWADLLAAHDAIISTAVNRHRGRQIKSTGDGALATFDGPGRAVRCAQAIVDGIRSLGVEARVGVHTGEIELRGDDVGGIGVHIAARVAGLAGPSQVLVSRTVTDLVAGSGIHFEDRGDHELRGVPGVWRLYSVNA